MSEVPIPDLTQEISGEAAEWYGGQWFVCETITRRAAAIIVKALGGELVDKPSALRERRA
jgi:hypothetical protein